MPSPRGQTTVGGTAISIDQVAVIALFSRKGVGDAVSHTGSVQSLYNGGLNPTGITSSPALTIPLPCALIVQLLFNIPFFKIAIIARFKVVQGGLSNNGAVCDDDR